ncbi:PH domain-containing protein [Mucilaginibacter sp. Bleaf8]|uniref:PH domain-containing protein n=1 Tax=Mucilaginibacter sp. Bleaf8 TaxID=2834430 RepID=UPI001BCF455B|nr:PH domain-containing protein [Mucilaginibacter sp. Bleaf8]MBS7562828.1 PH domain-containing protein [Mucilaginibacter sp. Bleaf8]
MIEKFLNDQQDPKAVEKVYSRLKELLPQGEETLYIACQKKPVVNIMPDCIVVTNRRVLFFTPANLGFSIKFVDFVWKDIADITVNEEFIGAVFMVKTTKGAEMGVDYLPKVQARKLYQYSQECRENERKREELHRVQNLPPVLEKPLAQPATPPTPPPAPVTAAPTPVAPAEPAPAATPAPAPVAEQKPDELTEKLKKLKMLFDNSLISQEEYNQKKMELLSEL